MPIFWMVSKDKWSCSICSAQLKSSVPLKLRGLMWEDPRIFKKYCAIWPIAPPCFKMILILSLKIMKLRRTRNRSTRLVGTLPGKLSRNLSMTNTLYLLKWKPNNLGFVSNQLHLYVAGIYFGGLLLQHLLRPLRCLPAKAGARLHVGQGQIIVIEERYAVIKSFSWQKRLMMER